MSDLVTVVTVDTHSSAPTASQYVIFFISPYSSAVVGIPSSDSVSFPFVDASNLLVLDTKNLPTMFSR